MQITHTSWPVKQIDKQSDRQRIIYTMAIWYRAYRHIGEDEDVRIHEQYSDIDKRAQKRKKHEKNTFQKSYAGSLEIVCIKLAHFINVDNSIKLLFSIFGNGYNILQLSRTI